MSLSRRNFLQTGQKKEACIRPPWAIDEDKFIEICIRCDDCVKACPEKIISRGDGGFPEVSFQASGCELCEECVDSCKVAALNNKIQQQAWQHKIKIKDECLPKHKIICRTCSEACNDDVFSFTLTAGKVPEPELNLESCTGCGFCIAMCPVKAIDIVSFPVS